MSGTGGDRLDYCGHRIWDGRYWCVLAVGHDGPHEAAPFGSQEPWSERPAPHPGAPAMSGTERCPNQKNHATTVLRPGPLAGSSTKVRQERHDRLATPSFADRRLPCPYRHRRAGVVGVTGVRPARMVA